MQNTMNYFNGMAAQLRDDAKNFENQIHDAVNAEKGKSLFDRKNSMVELSGLYADTKNKLNTVYQGRTFYEADMKNLLEYYALIYCIQFVFRICIKSR